MSEQVNECNSKSNQILFDIIIKEIDKENGFIISGDASSIQTSLHQLEHSDVWANMSKRASESVTNSGLDAATDNILSFMQEIYQSKSTIRGKSKH